METNDTKRLLMLCDSPKRSTGFGRVAKELVLRWASDPAFSGIDIWGINDRGLPAPSRDPLANPKIRHLAGGYQNWTGYGAMADFLNLLDSGDYSHVWVMQDVFQLANIKGLCQAFRDVCARRKVKSVLYFPVDAEINPEWTDAISSFDNPVAYTAWGKSVATQAITIRQAQRDGMSFKDSQLVPVPGNPIRAIPHGVETNSFNPLPNRAEIRDRLAIGTTATAAANDPAHVECLGDWLKPEDYLLVNVNQNAKRKSLVHSLMLVKELNRISKVSWKLLLHCQRVSPDGWDLEQVANQLGIGHGGMWRHTNELWPEGNNPAMSEQWLNALYNAADANVSTTLGEGWGLSLTEAAAAGCPVFAPEHTSCDEIRRRLAEYNPKGWFVPLPLGQAIANYGDESRVRFPIDVEKSAKVIATSAWMLKQAHRAGLSDEAKAWLSWDLIASEWMRIFKGKVQA